jgi:hypothetical protein
VGDQICFLPVSFLHPQASRLSGRTSTTSSNSLGDVRTHHCYRSTIGRCWASSPLAQLKLLTFWPTWARAQPAHPLSRGTSAVRRSPLPLRYRPRPNTLQRGGQSKRLVFDLGPDTSRLIKKATDGNFFNSISLYTWSFSERRHRRTQFPSFLADSERITRFPPHAARQFNFPDSGT